MVGVPPKVRSAHCSSAQLITIAAIGFLLSVPVSALAQNALPFTRSYLVTGNYAVVGVDLLPQAADCSTFSPNCFVKGSITVPTCPQTGPVPPGQCIPEGADVLAAFMYWETISPDPAMIPSARLRTSGSPSYVETTISRRSDVAVPSQASCFSSANAQLTMSEYSADVLRFFRAQTDSTTAPTGRRIVTGTHDIALPEVGTGNQARQSAGASILFVYRLPSERLRKIVVYDGVYLQQPVGAVMQQQLRGFYQSWDAFPSAWLTHIVSSGAKNTTERLKFNDLPVASDTVATDPFPFPLGDQGGSGSDRAWTNPTFDVTSKMSETTSLTGFGETASTAVDHTSNTPYECLGWSAIVFSTTVKDADADGLPDGLEGATAGLKDPDPNEPLNAANPVGLALPNLYAMGARTNQRDLFLEANGMWAGPTRYGDTTAPFSTILNIPYVETSARHDHLPTPQVIKMLGEAFDNAPGQPIRLHVDVGNVTSYKLLAGYASAEADKYLVCEHAAGGACTGPSTEARGGELIQETFCNPNLQTADATQPNSLGCHFPYFPGTIGWKLGLEHLRDQAVDGVDGHELSALQQQQCYTTGSYTDGTSKPCRRRFDPNRNGLIHYFLYAHALGVPKGRPCLDVSNPTNPQDVDFNATVNNVAACGLPLQNNPNYHVPRSTSGVADAPGANGLITVGLWDQLTGVGSPFLVAATTLHELGHNLYLSHGGKPPTWGNATTATLFEPNCKPNYPSIMSYLFQINGLLDLNGVARIDFSRGEYGDTGNEDSAVLNEAGLFDRFLLLPDASLAAQYRYRTAWFVPVIAPANGEPGNLAYTLGIQPANRYCTGVKFTGTPSMGRIDGPGLGATPLTTSLIDWDLNNSTASSALDVNFDGIPNAAYRGYNDWANLRLDQIGAGKTAVGFSNGGGGFNFGGGGFNFGGGGFNFGLVGFDPGQGGFELGGGGFNFGQGGVIFGATGAFDYADGAFNFGGGGFNFGGGGFNFGGGGFNFGGGGFNFGEDVDFDTVKKNGNTPPLAAAVQIIQTAGATLHRHRVTWSAPNVGVATLYRIYRALGAGIDGTSVVMPVCGATNTPVCPSGTTFVDIEELPYNQQFTYFVRAVFGNCNGNVEKCESGPSNFATTPTTVNDKPLAANDPQAGQTITTLQGQAITIQSSFLLANDTDADSAATRLRVALLTQLPTNGLLVPNSDGSFTYTPADKFYGTDSFKYQADDGTWRDTGILMSPLSNEVTVTITVEKRKK